MGAAALFGTALTQSAAPSQIAAAGSTATPQVRQAPPAALGLAPQLPAHEVQSAPNGTEIDYYVSPCLIPLSEIREITKEPLLFESKKQGEGLTSNIADARMSPAPPALDFPVCILATDINSVKLEFGVGVTHESNAQFRKRKQHSDNPDTYFTTTEVSPEGLPSATAALLRHGRTGDGRPAYSELSVHTRSGYTVVVMYSTMHKERLLQLTTAALSTLDGSRYGYNK